MKRFITILCVVLISLGSTSVATAQLTSTQRKAKTEIFNALRKIGTNVTDLDGGYIRFYYHNIIYIAKVVEKNDNPLYLVLQLRVNLLEEQDPDIARLAGIDAALNMPVYVSCEEGLLVFDCEMYAKNAKPFIEVLPNMINALERSYRNFDYEKAEKKYASRPRSVGSNSALSDNIFIFPYISQQNEDSHLYISQVTFDSQYTILDMISYNGAEYQNCSISRNSYLTVNGKRYKLIKAEGISYAPEYTDYPGWQSRQDVCLNFKLYFPKLPAGTTKFDFSEGTMDGWQLRGVELKHGKSMAVNGKELKTSFHKWQCISIEIQSGQTIVTKTCTPIKANTYLYSSQEEYIQDADTGKKYYLVNSSIGFGAPPIILKDTEMVTFYEVYPALPVSVKRININSGDANYVENLQIR